MFLDKAAGASNGEPKKPYDDTFHVLVKDINAFLAQSPGSDFSDIDPQPLVKLMKDYESRNSEWVKYAQQSKTKCFTRNLVDRGNGKHNLLILVWTPGKESPIHDHAGSHCIMKMLQGSLRETQYDWPDRETLEAGDPSPVKPQGETIFSRDEVTYISDDHGLHKISNGDTVEYAVSLHLYAPPNAAKHGCQVFDEKTGKATHVIQYDLFSEMGVKKDSKREE